MRFQHAGGGQPVLPESEAGSYLRRIDSWIRADLVVSVENVEEIHGLVEDAPHLHSRLLRELSPGSQGQHLALTVLCLALTVLHLALTVLYMALTVLYMALTVLYADRPCSSRRECRGNSWTRRRCAAVPFAPPPGPTASQSEPQSNVNF